MLLPAGAELYGYLAWTHRAGLLQCFVPPIEQRGCGREGIDLMFKTWTAEEFFVWNGKYCQLPPQGTIVFPLVSFRREGANF
jgi:hypothetical protein